LALCKGFMSLTVANLDNDWQLSTAEIDQAVRTLEAT